VRSVITSGVERTVQTRYIVPYFRLANKPRHSTYIKLCIYY